MSYLEYLCYISLIGGPIFYYLIKKGIMMRYLKNIYLMSWFLAFSMKNKQKTNISTFTICDSGKSASLTYQKYGVTYMLNIPYNKKYIAKMINMRVFLIKEMPLSDKNNIQYKEIEITQQPGVNYLVTPAELGGKAFKVIYEDSVFEIGENEYINIDKIINN